MTNLMTLKLPSTGVDVVAFKSSFLVDQTHQGEDDAGSPKVAFS